MKKRKLSYLELPKDIWTLISQHCEWPEASALRMVCKSANEGIPIEYIQENYKEYVLTLLPTDYYNMIPAESISLLSNSMHILVKLLPTKEYLGDAVKRFAKSHNYIK